MSNLKFENPPTPLCESGAFGCLPHVSGEVVVEVTSPLPSPEGEGVVSVYRQPMNTFTLGFSRLFAAAVFGRIAGDNVVGSNQSFNHPEWDNAYMGIGTSDMSHWASDAHRAIWADYSPNGFEHETMNRNAFDAVSDSSTQFNDPFRGHFDYLNNSKLDVSYNEARRELEIRKTFRNVSGANQTVRRLYLMTTNVSQYHNIDNITPSQRRLIVAMEDLEEPQLVPSNSEVTFVFNLRMCNIGHNALLFILYSLGYRGSYTNVNASVSGDATPPMAHFYFADNVPYSTNANVNSVLTIGDGGFVEFGDNGTVDTQRRGSLISPVTGLTIYDYKQTVHHYNEALECYDTTLEVFFGNTTNSPITIREVGCFRSFEVFHGSAEMCMSHRMTFPAETIEAHGGAYFTIGLRTFCKHYPMRMLNITASTNHVASVTPSGMRHVGERTTVHARRHTGFPDTILNFDDPAFVLVPPVPFDVENADSDSRAISFVMPDVPVNVSVRTSMMTTITEVADLSVSFTAGHGRLLSVTGSKIVGDEVEVVFLLEPTLHGLGFANPTWYSMIPQLAGGSTVTHWSLPNNSGRGLRFVMPSGDTTVHIHTVVSTGGGGGGT